MSTDCEQNKAETNYSNERYSEENDTKINPRKSNNSDVPADFEQNKIETNDIDETHNEQNDSSLSPFKLENEDVPVEKEKEKVIKTTKNKLTNEILKKLESLTIAEGSLVDGATDIISTSYPRREVDETLNLRLRSTLMMVRIYCIAF